MALSPYADSDEVSRALLWFRSLNRGNSEMVEEFSNMLNQTFSKDEIISAQNQVLEVAKSVADVSTVSQLYVTSDRQLTDVIANDVVQVSDLVHAAIFNLLPDLLVLAKEDEELNKGLENSKYKDLIEVAKGKLSDLTNEEVYAAALSKAKTSMKNAEDEMKEIGLDISYKTPMNFSKPMPVWNLQRYL